MQAQPTVPRLTRSDTDKRIGGVCGGIAEYFGIDPLYVRLAFVVASFLQFGILLYLVLWIALPHRAPGEQPGAWARGANSAVQIAEERYARGEITAEELAQIRADILGGF